MNDEDPIVPGYNAPRPDDIYFAARAEKPKAPLREYMDAIVELRDNKRFSFREIAEWFSENVAQTDHNAVYREYKKHKNKELEQEEKEWGPIDRHPEGGEEEETAED